MAKLAASTIMECRCDRCGHVWQPRAAEPKTCPRCKSYRWNILPPNPKQAVSEQ